MGYTLIPDTIKTEDDLIKYYKDGNHPKVGGTRYIYTTKDKIGKLNKVLVYSFYMYNKIAFITLAGIITFYEIKMNHMCNLL